MTPGLDAPVLAAHRAYGSTDDRNVIVASHRTTGTDREFRRFPMPLDISLFDSSLS
ncbi:MAG: hypothetical protein AAEJ46_07140 [Planctomycetota bacterium]